MTKEYPPVEKGSSAESLLELEIDGLRRKYQNALAEGTKGFNVTGARQENIDKIAEETGWKEYADPEGQKFLKAPEK